ncbi:MAG: DUF4256 domain-containing protein [Chloroflexota bacterium]
MRIDKDISPTQIEELLSTLETRFESNMRRHEAITWADVQARLLANDEKLATLHAMETTGGEPDVIGHNADTGEYIFCDCSAESPTGRRSICYDGDAEAERHKKKVYPAGNAVDIAAAIGVDLLTERQYRSLQQLGDFDLKTSSWVQTPPEIRERGGALFCDRRYDHVFTYHNGAPSFYAARGFRGLLRV